MPSAQNFLSSIGVNTHVDATTTPYGNVALVAADLAYLGVTHIRDHAWDTDLPAYRVLAAKGIKFDLIVDDQPQTSVPAMTPIAASIVSFEGSNEVDINPITFPGARGSVAAAIAEQKAMYTAVRSNPALSAIPVINQSVGDPNNYARYTATIPYSDAINIHAYAAWGDAPRYVIPDRLQTKGSTTKPSIVTETGYFTLLNNPADPSGVTESVQARFTLDTLFDTFSMGVTQTYLYELLDEGPDPAGADSELHYGLFHADGTPKLAATAIHNLSAILSTAGAVQNPSFTMKATLSGMPDTGNTLTLTGSDGSAFLAVWAEPQVWNTDAQTELPIATSHVTVDLGGTAASVEVFDPLLGTNPIATYANISTLTLDITDHPLIIQAAGTPKPQVVPATVPPIVASPQTRDALAARAGSTIIDAANSAVLVGHARTADSFFVDPTAAHGPATTIVSFRPGDTVTLWGFVDGTSTLSWKSNQNFNGYRGATLHAELAGKGQGGNTTLTLAGFSMNDVRNKLDITTGTIGGNPYLRLTDHG